MVIDKDKLKAARGARTQEKIVEAAGNKFSVQQLSAWEHGLYRPRPKVVPALCAALGVAFDAIAVPFVEKSEQIAA